MRIDAITIRDVANFSHLALKFTPQINIVCGSNGVGKSNLLKAVADVFTGPRPASRKRAGTNSGEISYVANHAGKQLIYTKDISAFEPLYSVIGSFSREFGLRYRDDLGKRTLDVLYLNDPDHLIQARVAVGEALYQKLEELEALLIKFDPGSSSAHRDGAKSRGFLQRLLKECQPDSELGTLAATIVTGDPSFQESIKLAQTKGVWDQELDRLVANAQAIALFP